MGGRGGLKDETKTKKVIFWNFPTLVRNLLKSVCLFSLNFVAPLKLVQLLKTMWFLEKEAMRHLNINLKMMKSGHFEGQEKHCWG